MTLKNREARGFDAMRLEKVGDKEEDGIKYEVYKKLVTKNGGELQDFVEVAVPASLEDAMKLEDGDELVNFIQKGLVDQEADKKRRMMVTEEEKEAELEKTKDEIAELKEKLEALGYDKDEIAEKINL